MDMVWIALGAVIAVAGTAITIRRFLTAARSGPTQADLGTVSDGWLSDNRSRKDL
jgi:hypothetical protein